MYKVLLIAFLLCIAETGFSKKKIDLRAQTRSTIPSIEVSIDDVLNELIFDFGKNQGKAIVVITDIAGNNICNVELNADGIYILPIPMAEKGKYILHIYSGNVILKGFFVIE